MAEEGEVGKKSDSAGGMRRQDHDPGGCGFIRNDKDAEKKGTLICLCGET